MSLYHKKIPSPVGELKIVSTDTALMAILWENDSPERVRLKESVESPSHPFLLKVERQLAEYFAGSRRDFDLELSPEGTSFQREVWQALREIPFGQTRSYGELARRIAKPKACRAVGAANGKNPLSIVVPCHRVIGSNGTLTGFAGGLKAKSFLIELERRLAT